MPLLIRFYLYHTIHSILSQSPRLYEKLLKVAEKGHHKAMEKVAYAMLFGDYMGQKIPKAKEMFERLAIEGSPKAQTVRLFSIKEHLHTLNFQLVYFSP